MKRDFLIFLLSLSFLKVGVFAKCPVCPEKAIKREVEVLTKTKEGKGVKKGSVSFERLQKKIFREKPSISSAKTPFPAPASVILKKEKEITLPDGTVLRLITQEDLKDIPDIP